MTEDERKLLLGIAKVSVMIGAGHLYGRQEVEGRPSIIEFYRLIRKLDPSFILLFLEPGHIGEKK